MTRHHYGVERNRLKVQSREEVSGMPKVKKENQCQRCGNGYGIFPLSGKKLCRRCWREEMGVDSPRCGMCTRLRQPCLAHRGSSEVKITEKTLVEELQASMRRYEK